MHSILVVDEADGSYLQSVLANLILATVDFYGVGGVTVKLFEAAAKSVALHLSVTSGTTTGAAGVVVVELSVPLLEVVF